MATNKTPNWMTAVSNSHITLKLSKPSEFNGVTLDTVTLRTPTVGDMRAAQNLFKNDREQQELYLYATLLECGKEDFDKLSICDYTRIQEAYFRLASPDGIDAGAATQAGAAAG